VLQPRAIPCLLLKGDGLVKTQRFGAPRYIGDPLNAVRLFNELQADELVFLDITATVDGRGPDFARVADLAGEAFMPLAYGGGVRTVDDATRLFQLGVEKVVVTSAAAARPQLVTELAETFGSQSVVVGVDVKRGWFNGRGLYTHSGSRRAGSDPAAYARAMQEHGAGELLLNSIDRDGGQQGYDLDLIRTVTSAVTIPVVACGGAGSLAHLAEAVGAGASGAAAGSLFVFSGPRRAVLINYPSAADLAAAFAGAAPAPRAAQ
jgi:cyclase